MKRLIAVVLFLVIVTGCTTYRPGGYYRDDGPHPRVPVDIAKIRDAVPRREPIDKSRSRPYTVLGKKYFPLKDVHGYRERGIASWYGRKFHGRRTATGERYDMYAMTAAHKTLPLPSYVRVRNLKNNKSIVVRVNDRGPFLHNRLIDLSYVAAAKLDILRGGTGQVEVTAVLPGERRRSDTGTGVRPVEPVDKTEKPALSAATTLGRSTHTPVTTGDAAGPAVSASGTKIFLQVGAFSVRENASKLRARLERAEFKPVVVQSALNTDNARYYRVRIGPLESVEQSDAIARRILEHGINDAHTVVE